MRDCIGIGIGDPIASVLNLVEPIGNHHGGGGISTSKLTTILFEIAVRVIDLLAGHASISGHLLHSGLASAIAPVTVFILVICFSTRTGIGIVGPRKHLESTLDER